MSKHRRANVILNPLEEVLQLASTDGGTKQAKRSAAGVEIPWSPAFEVPNLPSPAP